VYRGPALQAFAELGAPPAEARWYLGGRCSTS